MITVHPQYITDAEGNKISVILPVKEFEALLEELDEMEDIRLYDEAMKENDGERILWSDYLRERKKKNE
ncbi:MAG: hypothetical protein WBP41_15755 [Saprospiraceae bacterium]